MKSKMNRRDVLTMFAMSGMGWLMAACAPSATPAANRRQSGLGDADAQPTTASTPALQPTDLPATAVPQPTIAIAPTVAAAVRQSALAQRDFYAFKLGALDAWVINDGDGETQAFPSFGGKNSDEDTVQRVMRAAGMDSLRLQVGRNILVVRDGSELMIVDAGLGRSLIPNLRKAGIEPEQITGVVLSHNHFGHHNGLLAGGAPAFPNARVFLSRPEWQAIESAPPAEFAAVRNRLEVIESDGAITSSVRYIATQGHTVGHQAVRIESGDQRLIAVIDSAYNQIVSFRRPDLSFTFDGDDAAAAESRRAILRRIVDEGAIVHGYHFPFPGLGQARVEGDAFAFEETLPVFASVPAAQPVAQPVAIDSPARTFTIVSGETSASYTVGKLEKMSGNAITVTGRSAQVNGAFAINTVGTPQLREAKFSVDISALDSGEGLRDAAIRTGWLESARFPLAEFTATSVADMPASVADGAPFRFKLSGTLRMRDIDAPVVFDVEATLVGGEVRGTASAPIAMSSFGFAPPDTAFSKVDDALTVTIQFVARADRQA
jgi:glyoxylase-like metal-dependent hydrolase (beta-lactamase superfamily II)